MPGEFVDKDDVEQNLNFLEKLVSHFSSDDEYRAAMLNNQKVQTEILSDMAGVGQSGNINPSDVDITDLPTGLVGKAESSIAKGDKGRAVFDISGSKFQARIDATADIEEDGTVIITGPDNEARPSRGTSNALSLMVGSDGGALSGSITPRTYNVHESDELDHSNDVGAVVLEPGDEKVIVSTGGRNDTGSVLAIGATNQSDVTYRMVVDGEYNPGGTTNSPLGTVNEPFSFHRMFGSSLPFAEGVEYIAEYDSQASGEVEVVAVMHTAETS